MSYALRVGDLVRFMWRAGTAFRPECIALGIIKHIQRNAGGFTVIHLPTRKGARRVLRFVPADRIRR